MSIKEASTYPDMRSVIDPIVDVKLMLENSASERHGGFVANQWR